MGRGTLVFCRVVLQVIILEEVFVRKGEKHLFKLVIFGQLSEKILLQRETDFDFF